MSLWKWFGIPRAFYAAPSLFTIIKDVANDYSDKKKECNDDVDKGKKDDVED